MLKHLIILIVFGFGQIFGQLPSLNNHKLINNLKEGNKRFVNNKTLEKDFPCVDERGHDATNRHGEPGVAHAVRRRGE